MLMSKRILIISKAIKRRLIHRASTYNFLNEKKNIDVPNTSFDQEKLDLSNTSIKPFLNTDKINVLKSFYETRNEIICTYNFVIDEDVARDIVKNITGYEKENKKIIVEGNPGIGLITVNLLDSDVSEILVYDHSELWDLSLAQLHAKHPNKITKKSGNMNKSADLLLSNSLDLSKQSGLPVAILGITTSFYFLRGLVINFTKYDMWQSKLQVFLVVSSFVWTNLKDINRLRYFKFHGHCLFNLLFNAEELTRYPRAAFLPFYKYNTDDMVLIRVSINPNAFEYIKENELHDYFAFLRIIGSKKSNFIVPVLEKWLPGCGPYLISKGISMTTQVSELSHDETLLLYNFFKNCEGYEDLKTSALAIFSR